MKPTVKFTHTGRNLSDALPIWNDLKQGDALLPLLFNFALEYAIRKDWNWMENHLILVYADDFNIKGKGKFIPVL
jgi:hypothetical protein